MRGGKWRTGEICKAVKEDGLETAANAVGVQDPLRFGGGAVHAGEAAEKGRFYAAGYRV